MPQRRPVSKSPVQGTARHGVSANISQYLKLLEELKQLAASMDEASVELNHLSLTFNKRCRLLRDPNLTEQAEELRQNVGIPSTEELDNN